MDDIGNSQTWLLKKISQLEAEDINLANRLLEEKLPETDSNADATLYTVSQRVEEFTEVKDQFVRDNYLDAGPA